MSNMGNCFLFSILISALFQCTICGKNLSFIPLTPMQECFSEINELGCMFSTSSKEITTTCLKNITNIPVFRIVGEFEILTIECSAQYPIDSLYYGMQPTEAIFTEWWKEIVPNAKLKVISYYVKLKIYSVDALFKYYNDISNYNYEPEQFQPIIHVHDYSRSGNFSFPGIFNHSVGPSFYLFLEDKAKLSILRNKNTISPYIMEDFLVIPCIPSHFDPTNIDFELRDPNNQVISLELYEWNEVDGYHIKVENQNFTAYYGNYTCTMHYKEQKIDQRIYNFQSIVKKEVDVGLENFNFNAGQDLEFEKVVRYDPNLDRTLIYPTCKVKHLVEVDTTRLLIISVPSDNFAKMRQVRQFALPEFYNQSYTAVTSREDNNYDNLIRQFSTIQGSKLRMGTTFCQIGDFERVGDYGASILGDVVVNFDFGQDWAKFDRTKSSASTHFQLKVLTPVEYLYADSSPIKFSCKVNIPVVVPPIIWFLQTKNGTMTEEFIDYHLDGEESIFEKKLPLDTDKVYCFGSYWYSDFWRNVSARVELKSPQKPEISNEVFNFIYKLGSSQTIKCEAKGLPMPEIYFQRHGQRASFSQNSQNFALLELKDIRKENYGSYVCIAKNAIGSATKEFTISAEENESDYILFILVPILVFFVTVIGAYVYINYFRKEKTGLTKQEIEDFLKGLKEDELPGGGGDYAHDFAQMCPYNEEYEIPQSRFKIDTSDILGSGAFGVVMKGTVDNQDAAIKTIKRNADKQYLKALLSELKIMIYLGHHPNLITLLGSYTKELNKGTVYVFVKYFKNGNLESFLRQHRNSYGPLVNSYTNVGGADSIKTKEKCFDFKDLLKWCTQISDGMKFLGSKKVIHGDLAARNVLLDENLDTKITDFGLSRQLYDYSNYVKRQQEPLPWRWMALESLKFLSFSSSSDVWASGITFWEIFTLGEVPYPGYSWTLDFVNELERGLRMACPKYATNAIYDILCECWHEIPEKRPSFQSLKDRFEELLTAEESDTKLKPVESRRRDDFQEDVLQSWMPEHLFPE